MVGTYVGHMFLGKITQVKTETDVPVQQQIFQMSLQAVWEANSSIHTFLQVYSFMCFVYMEILVHIILEEFL